MNFETFLNNLYKDEGGFLNDKGDYTNKGVRQSIYDNWTKKKGKKSKKVTDLTDDEIQEFYKDEFWDRKNLDMLSDNPKVQESLFNFGVNIGPERAIKIMQESAGSKADGILGPKTKKAIESKGEDKVLKTFFNKVESYYKQQNDKENINGWMNRLNRFRDKFNISFDNLLGVSEANASEPNTNMENCMQNNDNLNLLQGILSGAGSFNAGQKQQGDNELDDTQIIKKKVVDMIAKSVGEQAVEAYQTTGNVDKVLSSLQKMLPQGQQAVQGPQGGIIVGQQDQQQTPVAQPSLTPEQEAKTIGLALAGMPQQGQQQEVASQSGVQPNVLQKLFDALPGGTFRQIARAGAIQKLQGKQPLQSGERERIQLEHQNRMQQLMAQGIDSEEKATSEIFKGDLENLIQNYEKVNLKGTFGNLAGAPLGFAGIDREDRKQFQSSADSLVYSVASYIAGQEGRGLSDRDIDLVNKWAKFSLSDRTSDFKGKLKNLIQKANTRLKATGGTPLPSAEDVINKKQKAVQQNAPKVVSFEIEGE